MKNQSIKSLYYKNFKGDLFSTSSTEELNQSFWKIKKSNYSKELLGFLPDRNRSIVNISKFITDIASDYDEIIVFAFDALSFEYFYYTMLEDAKKYDLHASVLSSVFPSTSTAAWTSISTGVQPSVHGVYGTSFYLKEYRKSYNWIFNALADKENFDILWGKRQPKLNLSKKKTLFQKLEKLGFNSVYLDSHGSENPFPLLGIMNGSKHIPYLNKDFNELKRKPDRLLKHFLTQTTKLLRTKDKKKMVWNYIDVDDFIHEQGYKELTKYNLWETLFKYWSDNKSKKRAFLLISDHGQTEQVNCGINILKTSILNDDLAHNPAGAGRTMFFYPKKGKYKSVKKWLEKVVGDSGFVLDKKDLFKYKLLDENAVAQERLGDLITIATKPNFPSAGAKYLSEHGSLHSEEIFVPFLIQAN